HLVTDLFAGQYQSVFKGRGMEFAEVRLYQPGDDIRTIDWNVTARTGVAHVKRYAEERELTVMLMVDASASTVFGSVTPLKGTRHVLRVIREVLSLKPAGRGTDIPAALEHLGRVTKRRCVVFLVSDFLDPTCKHGLRVAARRHDVIAVVLEDPREGMLPAVGLVELEEAETGERYVVDTGDVRVREAFARQAATARAERDRMLRSADVDAIVIRTDQPYTNALLRFFRMRERRQ